MSQVLVKIKRVPSLAEMNRLVQKMIFERCNVTALEGAVLEEGVKQWPKKADMTPAEKAQLRILIQSLIDNEDGKFNALKDQMIKHGLDYKKVYSTGFDGGLIEQNLFKG